MNTEFVDLMLRPNGKYICADWCDDGEVDVRGDICWSCKFLGANALVRNCAEEYYDAYLNNEDDGMLAEAALDDLFDAIERLRALRLQYDMRGQG